MQPLTRKEFLRLAMVGLGSILSGRCLSACSPLITSAPVSASPTNQPTSLPATIPVQTDTPIPNSAASPDATFTSTSQIVRREDILKFFPTVPSRVVHMHHGGVWEGDVLQPAVLRQMLDRSIARLTGLQDALSAWQVLFAPTERIAIKVNTLQYGSYWTYVPLVLAVVERLQDAGIPADQIVIYDRSSNDLAGAGFILNKDGPGVRCYGTDFQYGYDPQWMIADTRVGISSILLGCDALINIPILKTHSMDGAGMSFALKNHYGTFDQPQNFHFDRLLVGLPALNALAPIRGKTRLIIGDALKIVQDNWYSAFDGDSICMSVDPVAHDRLGLKILNELQVANGINPEPTRTRAMEWLKTAAALGLGTDQLANMELVEEILD
jgi:hypothetical protein